MQNFLKSSYKLNNIDFSNYLPFFVTKTHIRPHPELRWILFSHSPFFLLLAIYFLSCAHTMKVPFCQSLVCLIGKYRLSTFRFGYTSQMCFSLGQVVSLSWNHLINHLTIGTYYYDRIFTSSHVSNPLYNFTMYVTPTYFLFVYWWNLSSAEKTCWMIFSLSLSPSAFNIAEYGMGTLTCTLTCSRSNLLQLHIFCHISVISLPLSTTERGNLLTRS